MAQSPGWAVPPTPGIDSQKEEELRAGEDYIRNALAVRAYRTSSVSVPPGITFLVWQTAAEDTSGFWQSGQSRLVVPIGAAGWYLISAGAYGSESSHQVTADVYWNGIRRSRVAVPIGQGVTINASLIAYPGTTFLMLPLLENDYIQLAIDNPESASTIITGGDFRTYLAMRRLV